MNTAKRHRSFKELREAAVSAGWGGDPLAEEILAAGAEMEKAAPSSKGALIGWACVGTVVLTVFGVIVIAQNRKIEALELEKVQAVQSVNQEITTLRDRLTSQQALLESTMKSAAASESNVRELVASSSAIRSSLTETLSKLDALNKPEPSAAPQEATGNKPAP